MLGFMSFATVSAVLVEAWHVKVRGDNHARFHVVCNSFCRVGLSWACKSEAG